MLLVAISGVSRSLLAAVNVYGLMAFLGEQRTQELGIRMAVEAQSSQLRNMVLIQAIKPA